MHQKLLACATKFRDLNNIVRAAETERRKYERVITNVRQLSKILPRFKYGLMDRN